LPVQEEAHYDVRYGLLGSVGDVTLSVGGIDAGADGTRVLKIRGAGQGSVLGLGSMRRRIESELDLTSLAPRRWTVVRQRANEKDGAGTIDSGARGAGNAWTLERLNPGQASARQSVTFQAPTDDPLGLLWRLRTIPPGTGQSQTHQLLDGLNGPVRIDHQIRVSGQGFAELTGRKLQPGPLSVDPVFERLFVDVQAGEKISGKQSGRAVEIVGIVRPRKRLELPRVDRPLRRVEPHDVGIRCEQ
jgi:hypothetical protein